jgi:hypothetical protein
MGLMVEFDRDGRTYTVESSIVLWNVHIVNKLTDQVSLETDVRTGDKLFVNWGQIPVIRLITPVDSEGKRTD